MKTSIELVDTGKDFVNRIQIVQVLRTTIHKWDLMKLKCFCMVKDALIQKKRQATQATEQEKIINYTSDGGLISKLYKSFSKAGHQENNNQ